MAAPSRVRQWEPWLVDLVGRGRRRTDDEFPRASGFSCATVDDSACTRCPGRDPVHEARRDACGSTVHGAVGSWAVRPSRSPDDNAGPVVSRWPYWRTTRFSRAPESMPCTSQDAYRLAVGTCRRRHPVGLSLSLQEKANPGSDGEQGQKVAALSKALLEERGRQKAKQHEPDGQQGDAQVFRQF